jgi:hypothetical protein
MFDKNKFHESSRLTLDSMYQDHHVEGIWSWLFENGVIVHFSIGEENIFSIDHIDNNEDLMKQCLEFINHNQEKFKVPLFWLLRFEYGSPMGIYECHINEKQDGSITKACISPDAKIIDWKSYIDGKKKEYKLQGKDPYEVDYFFIENSMASCDILSRGYNVVKVNRGGEGYYYVPLDRSALIFSDSVENRKKRKKW